MVQSDEVVFGAIRSAVQHLFQGPDRDELTVNNVRSQVEDNLQLDSGFLKKASWKEKSKETVKVEYDRLLRLEQAAGEPTSTQFTPAKAKVSNAKKSRPEPVNKRAKFASGVDKVPPRKRQKVQTVESDEGESESNSINDARKDSEDDSASEAPKKSPKAVPRPAPTQAWKKGGGGQHENEKQAKERPKGSNKASKSNPEKRVASIAEAEDNTGERPESESQDVGLDNTARADESESDMSVVLDEPPKRKQKPKSASHGHSVSKSSKTAKARKASPDISPDEAEMKILQIQLGKCGIHKIWAIILKPYGTDSKAKIKHLKEMLRDAGMEGRFSAAKAREIKETRELMADLEAVKEGEASWGMGRASRTNSSREKRKTAHEIQREVQRETETRSSSESDDPKPRIANARMELAFLGDEESDSDD